LQKHKRSTLIKDIRVRNENWQQKIISQLQIYKKNAPFYKQINELIYEILNQEYRSITQLNFNSLQKICSFLGIKTPISIFSELNLKIENVNEADEWALNISRTMNARTYINPAGGRELFDKNKFDKNDIKLRFVEAGNIQYNQNRSRFEAGLSIIDVMMFNTPEEIKKMLNNYTLI